MAFPVAWRRLARTSKRRTRSLPRGAVFWFEDEEGDRRSARLSVDVHELLLTDRVYDVINDRFDMLLDHYEEETIPAARAGDVATCLDEEVNRWYPGDGIITRTVGYQVAPIRREEVVYVAADRIRGEVADVVALLREAAARGADVEAEL